MCVCVVAVVVCILIDLNTPYAVRGVCVFGCVVYVCVRSYGDWLMENCYDTSLTFSNTSQLCANRKKS